METTPPNNAAKGVRATTDRLVQRVSQANRAFVLAGVRDRRNERLKDSSIYHWAHALAKLDDEVQGKPFRDLTPADLSAAFEGIRERLGPKVLYTTSIHVKRAWKDLLDTDHLPRSFNRALKVREVRDMPTGRLVPEDHFRLLLEEAEAVTGQHDGLPNNVLFQALLWVLWDSGFRAQELLSLNVGGVTLDGDRGAYLALPPDADGLKTGPRTIYVVECVGALRVLLSMHPRSHDAKAPLFLNLRNRGNDGRMQYLSLQKFIKKAAATSGVNDLRSWSKTVSAHDFRHSAATRRARGGWNEAQLRAYFGWSRTSKMPSYYVHLATSDLRDQVRRDAGVDNLGFTQALEAGNDAQALATLLQRLMHQGQQTQAPVIG